MQQKEMPSDKIIYELKNAVLSVEKAFLFREVIKKKTRNIFINPI